MRELQKEHCVLTTPSAIFNYQVEAFGYLIQQVVWFAGIMVFNVHSAQRLSSEAVFVLCQSGISPTIQSYNEQKVIEMSTLRMPCRPRYTPSPALSTLSEHIFLYMT